MPRHLTLLSVLVLLALAGCNTTAIPAPTAIPIPPRLGDSVIRLAVLDAIALPPSPTLFRTYPTGRWFSESVDERGVIAAYERDQSYLRVLITWDERELKTEIASSRQLRQTEGTIHQAASLWFEDLNSRLRRSLGEASASAARGENSSIAGPSEVSPFLDAVAQVVTPAGTGSAFCVDESGIFLTNAHVIGNETSVTLVLRQGLVIRATAVRIDDARDIAVLRASGCPAHLSIREVVGVGEEVWAVGAPRGLQSSISRGIVSGIRQAGGQEWIQTDAPLNPGNSGGPIIATRDGMVVGMSTVKAGESEGLGFAVTGRDLVAFVGGLR